MEATQVECGLPEMSEASSSHRRPEIELGQESSLSCKDQSRGSLIVQTLEGGLGGEVPRAVVSSDDGHNMGSLMPRIE